MKYYGFGTVTRHADEFISSSDNAQGHSTTVKKRYNKQFKVSARQAAKRAIREAISNLNDETIQIYATSRQIKKVAERKHKRIAKQEQWQRLQDFRKSDLYLRHRAWLESGK
jgi:hypothetical protein